MGSFDNFDLSKKSIKLRFQLEKLVVHILRAQLFLKHSRDPNCQLESFLSLCIFISIYNNLDKIVG